MTCIAVLHHTDNDLPDILLKKLVIRVILGAHYRERINADLINGMQLSPYNPHRINPSQRDGQANSRHLDISHNGHIKIFLS